jgi:hypothetical protein
MRQSREGNGIVHNPRARSISKSRRGGARSIPKKASKGARSILEVNHTSSIKTSYESYIPHACAGSNDFLKENEIDDLMTKWGIYKPEQERLKAIGGYSRLNEAIYKMKLMGTRTNPGAYFSKIVRST